MPKVEAVRAEAVPGFKRTMPQKIPRAGKIFALLCIPLICLAVYYSPALTSLGWHIIHGNAIDYRGLRVEVPWGWTADLALMKEDFPANPQGITLQKPPKTLNIEARGPELIYINLLLPDGRSTPPQQAAEWKGLFQQSHPGSEFNVAVPANFPQGIDCLEAIPRSAIPDAPTGTALGCISLQGGWLADYAGSHSNVPVFLKVISGLKPQR
jgi:hypothetical protein